MFLAWSVDVCLGNSLIIKAKYNCNSRGPKIPLGKVQIVRTLRSSSNLLARSRKLRVRNTCTVPVY